MPKPCAHCGNETPSVGIPARPELCGDCGMIHDLYEINRMSSETPSPAFSIVPDDKIQSALDARNAWVDDKGNDHLIHARDMAKAIRNIVIAMKPAAAPSVEDGMVSVPGELVDNLRKTWSLHEARYISTTHALRTFRDEVAALVDAARPSTSPVPARPSREPVQPEELRFDEEELGTLRHAAERGSWFSPEHALAMTLEINRLQIAIDNRDAEIAEFKMKGAPVHPVEEHPKTLEHEDIVLPDGRVMRWACEGADLVSRSGEKDLWLLRPDGEWVCPAHFSAPHDSRYEIEAYVRGAAEFGAQGYRPAEESQQPAPPASFDFAKAREVCAKAQSAIKASGYPLFDPLKELARMLDAAAVTQEDEKR